MMCLIPSYFVLLCIVYCSNAESQISNRFWGPLNYDIHWKDYHDNTEFCNVKLLDSNNEPQNVEFIGGSKTERQYNCAKIYEYCLKNFVGKINCATISSQIIKRIEPNGCNNKGDIDNNNNNNNNRNNDKINNIQNVEEKKSSQQAFLSPLLILDKQLLQNIAPITFVVLGDSTTYSKQREFEIRNGWGKFENILFIHDENYAQRFFPLLSDLLDHKSPLFSPCASIFFFVKNDAYVNTTSLRFWIQDRGTNVMQHPLYAGQSSLSFLKNTRNYDDNNNKHNINTNLREEDISYEINCTENLNRQSESYNNDNKWKAEFLLPFANWDSGILLNSRAVNLIISEIKLKDATQHMIQRLKHQKYGLFPCFSHGLDSLKRLAQCLKWRHDIRLTPFPSKQVLLRAPVACNEIHSREPTESEEIKQYPITIRSSFKATDPSCYEAPCNDIECLKDITNVIRNTIFFVPSCARYIQRLISWLKHIAVTLTNLDFQGERQNMEGILQHNQIFTIAAESDDIQFIRAQLDKHGFQQVEILIAKTIQNNLHGAQLKPMHGFSILYKRLISNNYDVLNRMKWFIHVDDDTTINLAGLAFRLAKYKEQNDKAILLTHLFDAHIPNGAATTLMVFSHLAFKKFSQDFIQHAAEWKDMEKTSAAAIHGFDVFYGTVARRTDVKLIHTEGIIKHGIIVDNTIVLAHELHTYNNFSNYAMDVTSNLYIKKANLFLALNENYIFKKSLLKETQSREDTYDHNKRPFSIKDQMIDTSKYFVEHNNLKKAGGIGLHWKKFLFFSSTMPISLSINTNANPNIQHSNLLKLYSPIVKPSIEKNVRTCKNNPSNLKNIHTVITFESNPLSSGGINPGNFAHAINDHLIPLYALKLLMAGRDSKNTKYERKNQVIFLAPEKNSNDFSQDHQILLNCIGVSDNLQFLASASFNCDAIRKILKVGHNGNPSRPMHVNVNKICSNNVYHIDSGGWERWWQLWSVHMNAAYNWAAARYMPNPSANGRSPYAIALIYRMFVSNLITKSIKDPFINDFVYHEVVFSNRKGRRRILNMNEIVNYAITELSDIVIVDKDILYFESHPLIKAARKLYHSKVWISPHGANMANMIFMNKGSTIIELLPYRCQRLRIFFQSMASMLKLNYMSIEPSDASDVDGLRGEMSRDATAVDEIALARRSCDLGQCIRGENWEYYNFTIDPSIVTENILIAFE